MLHFLKICRGGFELRRYALEIINLINLRHVFLGITFFFKNSFIIASIEQTHANSLIVALFEQLLQ